MVPRTRGVQARSSNRVPDKPQSESMNSQPQPDDVRAAIVRMTAVASQREFKRRLDDFMGRLHAETILEGVANFLDDADFKTRNTLGEIVRRLDRQRAVEVLNAVVLNSRRTTQARLSAATLLETYLETEVETSYLEDIGDQNEVILTSPPGSAVGPRAIPGRPGGVCPAVCRD